MSRVHNLGTIFSRVDGLIRKNLLPESDAPIWYEVYKRFPPQYAPTLKRVDPDIEIKEIFYKEDVLRAKIHKAFNNRPGVYNLRDNEESLSQKLLKSCQAYIADGMSEEEAIERLKITHNKQKTSVMSTVNAEPNMPAKSFNN